MYIQFSKIIPSPLFETDYSNSDVWGRDFVISGKQKVLVSAASGKGKTTFLNIIIGKRKDYVGTITVDGQDPCKFSLKEKAILYSRKIAMVHQALFLFDALRLKENIVLKNRLTSHKTDEEIAEMLAKLRIEQYQNQKVQTLSYGQKQRLAIVRALCQPFQYILLDEPFSHLDKENAKLAWELISHEAEKQNAGIILTSLDTDSQMQFDKILNL